MRIIIIDDELYSLDLLETMIHMVDSRHIITSRHQNPLEAIPAVLATKPDLIILDNQMPYLAGTDLIKMLMHTGCYFVLISACEIDNSFQNESFTNVYTLVKPFSTNQLRVILASIEKELKLVT
jgi:two-component SAPR family response regulator